MAITFAVRGDSLTPRYAFDTRYGVQSNTLDPAPIVDAGAIGGFALNLGGTGGLGSHIIHYGGITNWPNTPAFSLLLRFAPYATGFTHNLFMCTGGGRFGTFGRSTFQSTLTDTVVGVAMSDRAALTGINTVTFAHGGLTAGTYYDLFITFTGDTTANGCEVFWDGASLGTTTSTRSWLNPRVLCHNSLMLGVNNNAASTYIKVNEFVLWDTIEDPTSIGLVGGTGSLNGASRTDFVDVAPYDGLAAGGGGGRVIKSL